MTAIQTDIKALADNTLAQCLAGTADSSVRLNVALELANIIDLRITNAKITFTSVAPSNLVVGSNPVIGVALPESFTLAFANVNSNDYLTMLNQVLSKCQNGDSATSVRSYVAQTLGTVIDNRIKAVDITLNAVVATLTVPALPAPVVGVALPNNFSKTFVNTIDNQIYGMMDNLLNLCLSGTNQNTVRQTLANSLGDIIDNRIKELRITLNPVGSTLNAGGASLTGTGQYQNFLINFIN